MLACCGARLDVAAACDRRLRGGRPGDEAHAGEQQDRARRGRTVSGVEGVGQFMELLRIGRVG